MVNLLSLNLQDEAGVLTEDDIQAAIYKGNDDADHDHSGVW